jgi:NSS family neurotransmitter:Na+ symporter
MTSERGSFSRIGFVLAAAGSAVGLGNLWKFSYVAHKNEGGSFVLIYLLAVVLVGFPIMMAEIVIGRSTQKSPVGAFKKLGNTAWSLVGWLGIAAGFVILSYYSVVAGWTIEYFIKCVGWSLHGFPAEAAGQFRIFLSNGWLQVLFHGLFMGFSVMVVVFGIKNGIERITKILMPVLFLILCVLFVRSLWMPGFTDAVTTLFKPTPLNPDMVLEAVGQAFFSLSLGMGAIITYGSYMRKKESIPKSAAMVCLTDTFIALLACVIIFSIIYSGETSVFGEDSIGVMFTSLPEMFYRNLAGGAILAPLFFLLVAFAALTSTISLLEVVVSYFIDQLNWNRVKATIVMGLAIFSFGVLSALSMGSIKGMSSFNPFGLPDDSTGVLSSLDYLATNWFLPIGGILIAVFAGWYLKSRFTRKEIEEGHGPSRFHGAWKFLLRFVAPLTVGWIIYAVIFMGKAFN